MTKKKGNEQITQKGGLVVIICRKKRVFAKCLIRAPFLFFFDVLCNFLSEYSRLDDEIMMIC